MNYRGGSSGANRFSLNSEFPHFVSSKFCNFKMSSDTFNFLSKLLGSQKLSDETRTLFDKNFDIQMFAYAVYSARGPGRRRSARP
ncbi:hypothetical protein EVAR_78414_1 [Eumeta japonica]|uniref:Uncharacterized protein n=1 Tax=Eumeta variegata TaxID=151549 RepID=A0A4C1T6I6_EUMVA|nr:hypothetical protein EVAR_78414_1 [Eumeta japonica]